MNIFKTIWFGSFVILTSVVQALHLEVAAIKFTPKSPGFEANLPGISNALTIAAQKAT